MDIRLCLESYRLIGDASSRRDSQLPVGSRPPLIHKLQAAPARDRHASLRPEVTSSPRSKAKADLAHAHGLWTRPTICSVGDAQEEAGD